ncbi:hypothetical protein CPZ13_11840 [Lacticaseibacillus paracasei]|nr:hypothetical protein CPZ14_12375 [Lacticaseibacillus paracasei]PCL33322.1 hypothetical protein CPZ13_11840 [Lacticaseibacillus paracasei]
MALFKWRTNDGKENNQRYPLDVTLEEKRQLKALCRIVKEWPSIWLQQLMVSRRILDRIKG